ncbi:MAG: MliC family protein [Phenylobacterium sp.]|uniref:MliC family protein n=1 Tax=Phenylobacterium sp. TaxID=1871053 RepID=UPI002726D589|nr:MliC family protein [Phenylobacterium sp.]MDO8900782.1 MliC family protein [Phenylobacterium sp.]MDP2213521.1 MliC family protein [Phenylobacterium sp.]
MTLKAPFPLRCASLIGLAILTVGGCEPAPEPRAAAGSPAPAKKLVAAPAAKPLGDRLDISSEAQTYRCENGERLQVVYRSEDSIMLTYRGETHFMTLARSASGARYVGGGRQWWAKGTDEGTLSRLSGDEALAGGAGMICRIENVPSPATHVRPPAQ